MHSGNSSNLKKIILFLLLTTSSPDADGLYYNPSSSLVTDDLTSILTTFQRGYSLHPLHHTHGAQMGFMDPLSCWIHWPFLPHKQIKSKCHWETDRIKLHLSSSTKLCAKWALWPIKVDSSFHPKDKSTLFFYSSCILGPHPHMLWTLWQVQQFLVKPL